MVGEIILIGGVVTFIWGCILNIENNSHTTYESDDDYNPCYTTAYASYFKNLGILKDGDWVKCLGIADHSCYKLISFEISDTLKLESFRKNAENIAIKLMVKSVDISMDKGILKIKAMKDDKPMVRYNSLDVGRWFIPVGVDDDNNIVVWSIRHDSHLIVGGASNSGKSSEVNMIIDHIANSGMGKCYLCDMKGGLEFGMYKDCSFVEQYTETMSGAKKMIAAFTTESTKRYKLLKDKGYKNYYEYVENLKHGEVDELGLKFLIMDEFADLTQNKKDDLIGELINLSRKCRAVGMVLILATQKPSADAVPTALAANVSARVGLRTTNGTNSRTIIDENGCEDLEPFNCIGILKGRKVMFRMMYLDQQTLKDTCKKYRAYKDSSVELDEENPIKEV